LTSYKSIDPVKSTVQEHDKRNCSFIWEKI